MRQRHAHLDLVVFASGLSCCIVGTGNANAQTTPTFDILSTFNFIQSQGLNDGGFLSGISDNFGINVSPLQSARSPRFLRMAHL